MSKWYEHHRGVPANVLKTPEVQRVELLIDDIIDVMGIGLVHGDAGLGKTFAVGTQLHQASKRLEVIRVTITQRPTEAQVLRQILKAITGVEAASRETAFALFPELIAELSLKLRLIVLDEAQKLSTTAIEVLRHLHDDSSTTFALLLVGGNDCWETLSSKPMLRSRIDSRISFTRWHQDVVLQFIPQYHAMYAKAPGELLLEIDGTVAHGNMRSWASFTRKALNLCVRLQSPLTAEIAAGVYATESGVVSAPPPPKKSSKGKDSDDA